MSGREQTALERLQELKRHLGQWTFSPGFAAPIDGKPAEVWIRERTDLWRRTWILPHIDALIEREERKRNRRRKPKQR